MAAKLPVFMVAMMTTQSRIYCLRDTDDGENQWFKTNALRKTKEQATVLGDALLISKRMAVPIFILKMSFVMI